MCHRFSENTKEPGLEKLIMATQGSTTEGDEVQGKNEEHVGETHLIKDPQNQKLKGCGWKETEKTSWAGRLEPGRALG
jgi:hypothetical protein